MCDETGYTYNITVYLGRDRQRTVQHLTATHSTESELTEKIQGDIFNRTAEISLFNHCFLDRLRKYYVQTLEFSS